LEKIVNHPNSKLVYSTDQGKMCPACGKALKKCSCQQKKKVPKSDGIVRIGRSSKGRKGKGVTIITGIPLPHDDLKKLTRQLKQKIGTGGTVKNNEIEIQGDHRSLLADELKKRGYTVKLSGG